MSTETATPETLNNLMEFDRPIRVLPGGLVTYEGLENILEPVLDMEVDSDGQDMHGDAELIRQAASYRGTWELITGYTGQYSYNGPVMHPSEFIGGGMARDILARPGVYVAVTVECSGPDENEEYAPAGWAVAYRECHASPDDSPSHHFIPTRAGTVAGEPAYAELCTYCGMSPRDAYPADYTEGN